MPSEEYNILLMGKGDRFTSPGRHMKLIDKTVCPSSVLYISFLKLDSRNQGRAYCLLFLDEP